MTDWRITAMDVNRLLELCPPCEKGHGTRTWEEAKALYESGRGAPYTRCWDCALEWLETEKKTREGR